MQRFIILLCLTAASLSPRSVCAQLQHYCVAGDVTTPQTYGWPAGHQVRLQDLLLRAGSNGAGVATILRGVPLQQADAVSVGQSGDRGPVLETGDIVVFRDAAQANHRGSSNVVICGQGIPNILTFTGRTYPLVPLLRQLNVPASQHALGIRSVSGQTMTIQARGDEVVQHGDIVQLMTDLPSTALQASSSESAGGMLSIPGLPESNAATAAASAEVVESAAEAGIQDAVADSFEIAKSNASHSAPVQTASLSDNPVDFDVPSIAAVVEDVVDSNPVATAEEANDADTQQSGIWMLVFTGGLMFAAGLIIIGWLRTQQELQMQAEIDAGLRHTISADPFAPNVADHTADQSLSTVSEDCPILSAGLELPADEEESPEVDATTELVPQGAGTPDASWFQHEEEAIDVSAEADGAAEDLTEIAGTEEPWSDLEDLIRNRLPVDKQQISLPPQIQLYGKPAGPRRLRLDAAHTEIAAPHMVKRDQRRKMERAQVAASSKPAPAPTVRETTETPAPSRLDNALNYLEEQSGS